MRMDSDIREDLDRLEMISTPVVHGGISLLEKDDGVEKDEKLENLTDDLDRKEDLD